MTSNAPYTGPSVPEMLATHTLARNIIGYYDHPTSDRILDDTEMNLLYRFVAKPTLETRNAILTEQGIDGSAAEMPKGDQSLVAYLIFEHGEGRQGMLNEGEIELLKGWFEGMSWKILG
ncbi:hypothetical protein NX059_006120 [Plenodomus lindquistii]|nr:hypothetical protein NX059_006120 [Plenodomus lindquistii]